MRLSLALALALACAAPEPARPSAPRSEQGEDLRADVRLARRALEAAHPGYTRYTPRATLDRLWERLEARAASMTAATLAVELSRVVAAIRCSHTKLELSPALSEGRERTPTYLPFRFVVLEGRMLVEVAASGVALQRGDEVRTIDGRPVQDYFAAIAPLLSVDGDNDHARAELFARSEEYLGSGLDHFGPLIFGVRDEVALEVEGPNGRRTIRAPRLTQHAYDTLAGGPARDHDFGDPDAVRYGRVGAYVSVLRVNTFVNYREPVSPDTIFGPVFDTLIAEGRSLVLDLRGNGGGSDGPAQWLATHVLEAPIVEVLETRRRPVPLPPDVVGAMRTWDPSALAPDPADLEPAVEGLVRYRSGPPEPVMPAATRRFAGRLVVLTGPRNGSGVTHLLTLLRRAGRATLVGEPTDGAPSGATAGTLAFLTLPRSGLRVRVPLLRVVMAGGDAVPARRGLTPDVLAPRTVASFRAGEDPALEAALALLEDG